jgi:hypothetical protein
VNEMAQTGISNLIAWKEFRGESKALDALLFASRNSGIPLSRFQAHLILVICDLCGIGQKGV